MNEAFTRSDPLFRSFTDALVHEPWEKWYNYTRLVFADWIEEAGEAAIADQVRREAPRRARLIPAEGEKLHADHPPIPTTGPFILYDLSLLSGKANGPQYFELYNAEGTRLFSYCVAGDSSAREIYATPWYFEDFLEEDFLEVEAREDSGPSLFVSCRISPADQRHFSAGVQVSGGVPRPFEQRIACRFRVLELVGCKEPSPSPIPFCKD